jgi:hypothetical protein
MKPEIIILISDKTESDSNLLVFLNFYGIKYTLVTYREELMSLVESGIKCLAASYDTFSKFKDIEQKLYNKLSYILLYASEAVEVIVDTNIETSDSHINICKELAGVSFMPLNRKIFVLKEGIQYTNKLISIDSKPVFALKQIGNCQVFLLSASVIDINEKMAGKFIVKEHFISIAPIAMFIKYAFAKIINDGCIRSACLIIDDPILKENYGFLNYQKLLGLMDAHNFFTTIAVIPWNYNRTDKKIAQLFKRRPDRFSICVHGCDHTEKEFGSKDLKHIDKKVKLATARMIEHEKITGIPFDRNMVFPQGIFSIEAMKTLKNNNYQAALNSIAIPVNGSTYLTISDYMQGCIMEYDNFPLFIRNVPENIVDIALNLFLGKPVFLVIHNEYLENGYETLIDSIKKINSLSENIKWDGAGNIINRFVKKNAIDSTIAFIDLDGWSVNGLKENLRIFIRRYASEFRDNYVCKNKFLFNAAVRLKTILNRLTQLKCL